ncbi:MAG: hypothetical protein IPJ19_07155 [Planctomycetes bacterium]|nr:hypothetical protein [Planctomycetota bacterium]
MRWPGHTQAGRVENTCAGWDLMPTLAAACGAHACRGTRRCEPRPALRGRCASPRDFLYWRPPTWAAGRRCAWATGRPCRNLKKNIPGPIEGLRPRAGSRRDARRFHAAPRHRQARTRGLRLAHDLPDRGVELHAGEVALLTAGSSSRRCSHRRPGSIGYRAGMRWCRCA